MPFRIGRAETADLKIESAQVSREHAEIVERVGIWIVRDLGSMNGTHVNGTAITESPLVDGDILKIAESEFTFVESPISQFQRMVTQPLKAKEQITLPQAAPPEVATTRSMMEATLWQAIPTRIFAVTSLRRKNVEAIFGETAKSTHEHQLLSMPQTVRDRYREVYRTRAVELAIELGQSKRLFLTVDKVEIETAHKLLASLELIHDCLPTEWELGITISVPTELDTLKINEVYREARAQGILVAFDEFQGNGSQIMHLESLLPEYLILASSMMKDLSSTRQPLRRLGSLFAACDELSIKPVLPHNDCSHTMLLCQEIGYDLMCQPAVRTKVEPAAFCASLV